MRQKLQLAVEPLEGKLLLAGDLELLIDANVNELGWEPEPIIASNGHMFFTAYSPDTGRELWATDVESDETRLLADIAPGPAASFPEKLAVVKDALLFWAGDGLWRSDGTVDGTWLIADASKSDPPIIDDPPDDGAEIYFLSGRSIWRSDGTSEGTGPVIEFPQTLHSGRLYFAGDRHLVLASGSESLSLWQTDGHAELEKVFQFGDGVRQFGVVEPAVIGDTLFFVAGERAKPQLWMTDGTPEGTILAFEESIQARSVVKVGDKLFFALSDSSVMRHELWVTGDSDAGSTKLFSNPADRALRHLVTSGGFLYFSAPKTDGRSTEVWRSDGTVDGTIFIADVSSFGSDVDSSGSRVDVNGNLYFSSAPRNWESFELWKVDGETGEARSLAQLPTFTNNLTNVNGVLFFTTRKNHDTLLWRVDVATEAPQVIKRFRQSLSSYIVPSNVVESNLYFTLHGLNGLWRSNGTEEGTYRVTTSIGPIWTADADPQHLFVAGETVHFTTRDSGYWSSDGTTAGTIRTGNTGRVDRVPVQVGDSLFVLSDDRDLWKYDQTKPGSELTFVQRLEQPVDSDSSFVQWNGLLHYIRSNRHSRSPAIWVVDGSGAPEKPIENIVGGWRLTGIEKFNDELYVQVNGRWLWKTDGTRDGTTRLFMGNAISHFNDFVSSGRTTYFVGSDEDDNVGLWKTDGTVDGTLAVRSFGTTAELRDLIQIGDLLYFRMQDDENGSEVWRSDGTELGTTLVKDVAPGNAGSDPAFLTDVDGVLYFVATDPDIGRRIWRSDGTQTGTVIVADVSTENDDAVPRNLVNVDGVLHFVTGQDRGAVHRIWKTDGTETGTILVHEFSILGLVEPPELTAFNRRLVAATTYGRELWISPLDGDVNADGRLNAADIDDLMRAVQVGNTASIFDLDGNGLVDSVDVSYLIETVFETRFGDANLDGIVDAHDLNAVGRNWLGSGSWASGDFNADGVVDSSDLNAVGSNWLFGESLLASRSAVRDKPSIRLLE